MAQWRQKLGHMHHYDQTAQVYDTRYTEEQNLKIKTILRSLRLKNQSTIIDLGCGTGLLLPKIRKKARTIICLDISKGMLKKVKLGTKLPADVHPIQADADHTPFSNEHFDAAFAITLLQNMPNPRQTLQETKRITKPDAQIIITGLKKHFALRRFLQLLRNAKLTAKQLEADEKLKCHIAFCRKGSE
jgi:ubiquinone/menaquinone biosynthesis C-methylase UbiE